MVGLGRAGLALALFVVLWGVLGACVSVRRPGVAAG